MIEIAANLHMHTPYSDGHAYHDEIAQAAAQAGLSAVVTTDHNVYVRGIEGYRHGVMLLVGEEVHDAQLRPQGNHCLIYNAGHEMSPFAANPQTLIHETAARGGMSFLAHPVEYGSSLGIEREAYGWREWRLRDYTGIELWNYMSEFKARLWNWPAAILWAFAPTLAIHGPFPAALKLWDSLLTEGKRVVAIGNSDAHGFVFRLGPIARTLFPYRDLFRCVNTHVLIDAPLTHDFATDKKMLFDALRAGHCFVGYDRAASTRGFRFDADNGNDTAIMGDVLRRTGAIRFRIRAPEDCQITLLRNGRILARTLGEQLDHTAVEPGAYRVECHKWFRGLQRGWIFSNPIYVRQH
jgi:PHP domain